MATRLQREAERLTPKGVDPIMILTAVTEIIKMIQSCRNKGQRWPVIRKSAREDRQRSRARRRIVSAIGEDSYQTIGGDRFLQAAWDRGEELNAADINEMVAEL